MLSPAAAYSRASRARVNLHEISVRISSPRSNVDVHVERVDPRRVWLSRARSRISIRRSLLVVEGDVLEPVGVEVAAEVAR